MKLYGLMMHEQKTLSSLVNRLKSICTQLSYIGCNIEYDDKIAILLKSLPKMHDQIVTLLKEKELELSLESIINSFYEQEKKISKEESYSLSTNHAYVVVAVVKKCPKPCIHCGRANHA